MEVYLEGPGIVNYAPFPAEIKEPNESLVVLGIEGVVKFIWEGSDPDADDTLTYTLFLDKVDGKQCAHLRSGLEANNVFERVGK